MAKQGAHLSGSGPFWPGPRPGIPTQLQASFRLWLVAVAADLGSVLVRPAGWCTWGRSSQR